MKAKLAVAFAVLFFAGVAQADGGPGDTIVQISGGFNTATSPQGTPVQSSDPIVESFNVSYEFDETTGTLVPGSMSFGSSGNMGPLTLTQFSFSSVMWMDPAGDDVQLSFQECFCVNGNYFLGTETDDEQFWIDDYGSYIGDVTITDPPSVGTPEPSTYAMLIAGIVALIALSRTRAEE